MEKQKSIGSDCMNATEIAQQRDNIMKRRMIASSKGTQLYNHCKSKCTKLPKGWTVDRHHEACDSCPVYTGLKEVRNELNVTMDELRYLRNLESGSESECF